MEIYLTLLHHLNSNKKTHIHAPKTIKTIEDTTKEDFLGWLQNDKPSFQFDFYDKTLQAERILRILTRDDSPTERGQILFGDFGSGKSTVIKSVQKRLEQEKGKPWIVLTFDSWGRSESPEDLTAMILDEIVLGIYKAGIETISLQDMRNRYIQSAFKVSNRMSILEALITPKNPEATLEQINQLLLINNRKLLLVIEDSDRAIESEKVISTIAGLLDRVANFSEFRFIFTLKREAIETDIAYKIANHIEDINTPCPKELLKKFFELCMDNISFISPELRELNKFNEAGKLERLYTEPNDKQNKRPIWPLIDNISLVKKENFETIKPYIGNARTTRMIFKATWACWQEVKEGAMFTDVFLYQVIRHNKSLENDLKKIKGDIPSEIFRHKDYEDKKLQKYDREVEFIIGKKVDDANSEKESEANEHTSLPFMNEIPHTVKITDSNDHQPEPSSLLDLLQHPSPAEQPIMLAGLNARLAPDYWKNIIDYSISKNNQIKFFYDELDRISKNPESKESEIFRKYIYEIPGVPFNEDNVKNALKIRLWGDFNLLLGLLEHLSKHTYAQPQIYNNDKYERNPEKSYQSTICFIFKAIEEKLGCDKHLLSGVDNNNNQHSKNLISKKINKIFKNEVINENFIQGSRLFLEKEAYRTSREKIDEIEVQDIPNALTDHITRDR